MACVPIGRQFVGQAKEGRRSLDISHTFFDVMLLLLFLLKHPFCRQKSLIGHLKVWNFLIFWTFLSLEYPQYTKL